jgi:F-type H+-transporting ATPase subunit gamma
MQAMVRNLVGAGGRVAHPLLERRTLRTAGILVVASDRGLAGAYNTNVLRLAEAGLARQRADGVDCRVYVVGRRAQSYLRFRGYPAAQAFVGVTDRPTYAAARDIAGLLVADYEAEVVDSVEVVTTRYRSALTQVPVTEQLLPVPAPEGAGDGSPGFGYSYEPSPEEMLARLLPRYVEAMVFGILLEASASEYGARRRAMKAATENAEDLTRVLSRQANRARQSEITTEISEIVGGAEALTRG